MEFWEGAVLIVGGIWLVGRVHRASMGTHFMGAPVTLPSTKVAGPTSATNTDGSGFLIAGETLHTGLVNPGPSVSCPSCSAGLPAMRNTMLLRQSALPAQARTNYQRPLRVQF